MPRATAPPKMPSSTHTRLDKPPEEPLVLETGGVGAGAGCAGGVTGWGVGGGAGTLTTGCFAGRVRPTGGFVFGRWVARSGLAAGGWAFGRGGVNGALTDGAELAAGGGLALDVPLVDVAFW